MDKLQYRYDSEDLKNILGLLVSDGVGRTTIRQLLYTLKKTKQSWANFWVAKHATLEKIKNKNIKKKPLYRISKAFFEQCYCSLEKNCERESIRVVPFWDSLYPQLLLQIPDFPLVLFVKGDLDLLQTQKTIAVVGTRRMTTYGCEVTKYFSQAVSTAGFTVISGAMYGVDATAHRAVLTVSGKTIAVLGYGFGTKLSRETEQLLQDILQKNGVVLSEYPPHTPATRYTFPERNRIVAGMSQGILVTQAAQKSGTHITAGCAAEYGREVFAVSGSIFNQYSRGTRYLINQGATLVCSYQDILDEFPEHIVSTHAQKSELQEHVSSSGLDAQQSLVSESLQDMPQTVTQLVAVTGIEIQELLPILSMLELENKARCVGGVWHSVVSYSS